MFSKRRVLRRLAPALLAALAIAAFAPACGGDDGDETSAPPPTTAATAVTAATPTESPAKRIEARLTGVPGIVNPANLSWPRDVEGLNGRRTIKEKPLKIHTMSAGIDEITLSLVPIERVVGVGSATKNPDTSSFASLVKNLPTVAREPEAVIASGANLVIATPTQKADVVAAIESAGVTVVQLNLDPTPAGRLNAILLLGYIYGEEERAIALADEVEARYRKVVDVTGKKPDTEKPVVAHLTKYTSLYMAGSGTTGEGIITAAGGRNAGTLSGIKGNQQIGLEAILAANPDLIIIPMPGEAGEKFKAELMAEPTLAGVPAIKNGRVYVVPPALYTTNSFANVRAVEHLVHILWPSEFPVADPPQFSLAGQAR
ncbi:MAG: ABC transporter substrate-binding protein [Tepidiforma sp.]|jgi:iron complex transport system substrate-binding protein|uniref:ABC transporter substrate-binding protein n=1 Tax=Tepidiforma sp. TaxID=2682230 RepID=UPI0021DD796A|nr:ABC transporter substrate-binding protein [Tepidiforma sp.]GIW15074.1 MAG: ABC transporter substrate-binding protein [Tepidiforma sp.]